MKFIRSLTQEDKIMQIQINTDNSIKGHEVLVAQLKSGMENALSRISDHITRLEVHLSDENGDKPGSNDKRCMMEARLEGRKPIAVTDQAATLEQAVDGATNKLISMIESILGRQHDHRSHQPKLEQKFPEAQ
jgi:ribosome-associated translation inhibitor RaiA